VVAMDDFALGNRFGADFSGAGASDGAGEFGSVGVADADDFAGIERAVDFGDAGKEEAASLFAQGFFGAVIDGERAGRAMVKGDPAFAAGELAGFGNEKRAFVGAGGDRFENGG